MVKEKLKLTDLIDIDVLQRFQDFFAEAMDIACLIVDDNGLVTKPSNYNEFCQMNINNIESCDLSCDLHNAAWGRLAYEKKEPVIFKCCIGLNAFAVPLEFDGKYMGAIICGQMTTEPPDEQYFREVARNQGMDEEKYITALRKLRIMPMENIKACAKLLALLSDAIFEIGNKNYEMIEKIRMDDVYRTLVDTIRTSLNLDETLKIIAKEICKLFDVDRVSIAEFPNINKLEDFYVIEEYKTNESIKTLADVKTYKNVGVYIAQHVLEKNKPFIIDNIEESDSPQFVKDMYREMGVKSLATMPIILKGQLWGFLSLTKVSDYRTWSDEDVLLLEAITDQLYIAIKHAELFEKEKQISQRESFLRKTIEVIRSTLDVEEIKKIFIDMICEHFGADRCLFVDYDKDKNKFLPFKYEKLTYPAAKSLIGIDLEQDFAEFCEKLKRGKNIIIKDLEKILLRKNLPNYKSIQTLKNSDTKSDYGLYIKYTNRIMGLLIMHFVKGTRVLTKEELDFLKVVRDQVGIALYQAETYSQLKQQAQREFILRDITNKIRSSLDVEEIKNEVVNQLGKYFNADRVTVAHYDYEIDNYVITQAAEYRSSDAIKTFVGVDFANIPGFTDFIKNVHSEGKDIIFDDIEKYLDDNNLRGKGVENFYRDFGFASSAAINMYYEDVFFGNLVITFEHKRDLSKDDIKFMRVIADQVGVAFHQSELYDKEKHTAQKEKTLRQIMLASSASFNFEDIINSIVTATGKLLNADRCFYIEYNLEDYTVLPIQSYAEYRSSENIRSHTTRIPTKDEITEIVKTALEKQIVLVENIDKIELPESSRKMLVDDLGVKAYAIFSVRYADIFYGSIVLHYMNNYMHLTQDQIDMAKSLANQSAVIINQIKTYEKIQKTAEREKLLRKIIEISRSSLDFNEVRKQLIKALCIAFKADRCYFRSYYRDSKTFSKAEAEYLADENIPSLADTEPDNEAFRVFVKALEERNRAFYPLIVDESFAKGTRIEKYMEDVGVKVDYAIPILDRQDELSWFLLHYIKEDFKLDEEDNKLLETIAYQLDIAFGQIKLYNAVKQQGEREIQLRKLIQTIRSSLDLNETLKTICFELATLFNADRVAVSKSSYQDDTMVYQIIQEYMVDKDIKSPLGEEGFYDAVKYISKQMVESYKPFVINNFDQSPYPASLNTFYKSVGVKSLLVIPIIVKEKLWGAVTLSKIREYRTWANEDISFLESITDQLYIAINQSELYYIEKHNAEREAILRTISETIRSSLDISETKQIIVDIIGKTFKADRCFIMEYDPEHDMFENIKNEYLSANDVPPYCVVDINVNVPNFIKAFKEGKSVVVKDKKIFINGESPDYIQEKEAIEEFNVKNAYGFPIFYSNELLGVLGFHYIHAEHDVNDDEISLITIILEQIAIALHQAKLYNTISQATAKQNAILNNMPFMAWLKDKECRLLAVNNSFSKMAGTSIKNIIGKTDFDFFPKESAALYTEEDRKVMEIGQTISSVDIISEQGVGERWHETYKSPVIDNNGNIVGTVGLARDITDEKAAEIEIINKQNEILKATEREKLIGNLVARAISTFDINQIKQIVKDIGIISQADRCYFVEVDVNEMKGKPIDYEGQYLVSENIKSIIGYEFNTKDVRRFVDLFLTKKDLFVFDYDKIREEDDEKNKGIIRYANLFHLKSGVGIPFFSRDKLIAVLAIEYVRENIIPSAEELDFFRIVGNQIGMVFNQIKLYDDTRKTAEREVILRKIIEGIRSSLDLNTIKHAIVNEVCKVFNADRCFLITRNDENNTLHIDEFSEYKAAGIEKSFIDFNTEAPEVSWFSNEFKKGRGFSYSNVEDFLVQNNLKGSKEEKFIEANSIKSSYTVPVSYSDRVFGFIVVQYHFKPVKLEEDNINFLRTIAAQAGIAFNQAESYKMTKLQAEKESLLRQIFENIRSSFDINSIKSDIVRGTGKALNADICSIMDYNPIEDYFLVNESAEYLASDKEKSFVGFDTKAPRIKKIIDIFRNRQEILTDDVNKYIIENNLQGTTEEKFLKEYGIKSSYNTPIIYLNRLLGYLVVEYTTQYKTLDNEGLDFIRTIANQAGIALHQAETYKQTQIQAEREAFLRKIIETVGGSLDLESTLNAICKQIFEMFKPDRVAIENYPETGDYKNWLVTAQYKSGDDILGVQDIDYPVKAKEYIGIRLLEEGRDVIADDLEKSDLPDYFIDTHKKMGVKSLLAVPLKENGRKWGILVLSQVHNYRKWAQSDVQLLHTVVNQAAVAIRQAELYSKTKIQAEREKFSRNIIEILRSTIDKSMIKNLFVRYIAKFLDADRVLFSEYDENNKIYLPVDKQSEYLSSPKEKSFAGYDWTQEEAREYIQPLLDKRELLIYCWPEFISHTYKSQDFIELFEKSDVKSSYNFPILYQEKLMGFFCIEFTRDGCIKLPEEDVNMIRNICLQAGIALFHAQLYVQAKESSQSKQSFMANISSEIKIALNQVIENSARLSKKEIDEPSRQQYLSSLNASCKEMIELKDNITSITEIESENFKLNYETIDAQKLIADMVGPLNHFTNEKNIRFDTELADVEISADKKKLTKAIYNILFTMISLTPVGGHISVRSQLTDNKFHVSVKDWGEEQGFYDMNIIFEALKQIDSDFTMRHKDVRLGLSVAKKIIELHNGTIHVDSMEDNGTEIIFIIPYAPA